MRNVVLDQAANTGGVTEELPGRVGRRRSTTSVTDSLTELVVDCQSGSDGQKMVDLQGPSVVPSTSGCDLGL